MRCFDAIFFFLSLLRADGPPSFIWPKTNRQEKPNGVFGTEQHASSLYHRHPS